MRCASLAEEFQRRGWQVEFAADIASLPLADSRIADAGFGHRVPPRTAAGHGQWVRSAALDAVLLDSYTLDPEVSRTMADLVPVLTLIDGGRRGQSGSLYVDQNYAAEKAMWPAADVGAPSVPRLAGTRYTLIRDSLVELRPKHPVQLSQGLRLLVALGGTDAGGLTERVVRAIQAVGVELAATVITRDAAALSARHRGSKWVTLHFVEPTNEMPRILSNASAVIGAAGSSLWEAACLGVPVGAILVADNQAPGYEALVGDSLIDGLVDARQMSFSEATLQRRLARFLADDCRRRDMASRSFSLVDGRGKERVYAEFVAGAGWGTV